MKREMLSLALTLGAATTALSWTGEQDDPAAPAPLFPAQDLVPPTAPEPGQIAQPAQPAPQHDEPAHEHGQRHEQEPGIPERHDTSASRSRGIVARTNSRTRISVARAALGSGSALANFTRSASCSRPSSREDISGRSGLRSR